jgi:hypothetical protein
MRLVNPFTGRTPAPGSERTRLTSRRWRISVGSLMLAIVVVALLVWGGKEVAMRRKLGTEFTRTYPVGDLLSGPASITSEMEAISKTLTSSVAPDEWWPGHRTVTPFPMTLTVIIRDTEEGHDRVRSWLQERRGQVKGNAK